MPRYEDRYGSTTRLYVGHLSSRTRSRDLEQIFARYGRVRDVDMKRDYAFVEFSDPRDADDARYSMDGRDVDGRRITVEFAKGVPRGPGGVKEYVGRGPAPGSGRCFNCGLDGHWARDCKAGDWKNKCYRCGERGHIERNCQNSPKKLSGRGRSYSRSPARSQSRSRSPRRGHGQSRSFSRSPSRSRSSARRGRDVEYEEKRSRSRSPNERRQRSPARRVRDTEYDDKRSRSRSPDDRRPEPRRRGASPYESERRSTTPDRDAPMDRSLSPPDRDAPMDRSLSPVRGKRDREQDGYGESQREASRSPVEPRYEESPYAKNGREFTPSPREDKEPVEDENGGSPQGSESP